MNGHRLSEMPTGTRVRVCFADGSRARTSTQGEPWPLPTGEWGVRLNGITGSEAHAGGFLLGDLEPLAWEPYE